MVWHEVGKFFLNVALLFLGGLIVQPLAIHEVEVSLLVGGSLAALYFFVLGIYCLKKGGENERS